MRNFIIVMCLIIAVGGVLSAFIDLTGIFNSIWLYVVIALTIALFGMFKKEDK